jgi:hypothetical protein
VDPAFSRRHYERLTGLVGSWGRGVARAARRGAAHSGAVPEELGRPKGFKHVSAPNTTLPNSAA